MSLPAPNLDDRRFQDIVDEAKRRIARHCPEWTDHNVSDPGVALIELFAWMTEMILYRLNQVPDRLYVKFLELVGIELASASPARTDILFTLAAPPEQSIRVPGGTQVGTERGHGEDQIVFMTDTDLMLVRPNLTALLTRTDGRFENRTEELGLEGTQIPVFPSLHVDDAMYLGFDESLEGNLIRVDIEVSGAAGRGIDPRNPPRVWQSWNGRDWTNARVLSDTSDGFNTTGEITLLLKGRHENLAIGPVRAHWVRAKLIDPAVEGQTYDTPPLLDSVAVVGLGGAVAAHHAEPAPRELLGTSDGEPGQVHVVRRAPVLPRRGARERVEIVPPRREPGVDPDPVPWTEVADFTDATEDDRVYTWNGATGEIRFGPRVIGRDGRIRQYGAVPEEDSQIWVTGYRYGGGRRGNVGAGKLTVPLSAIQSVDSVRNLEPATGGVDAESVENAKVRGPLYLRGGHRAVTGKDFERLTLAAAPGAARARCLPPLKAGDPVRLLVVPRSDVAPETMKLQDLALKQDLVDQIKGYLDGRRLLTTQVRIDTPSYQGITIVAEVHAAPTVRPEKVREDAERALYEFVNPVTGGPDGKGWPFDADLSIGDIFSVLRGVAGVSRAETVHMFLADLRGQQQPEEVGQRVRLAKEELFMSVSHRVVVRQ
ncbi:putative baseplate assembly protein [Kibdelosporangium philippinense]|uniref:Baseplate assembly protein n=1 Tax=Kibdelosporangium philippinense TaxID=211113 RepID=A0ABS8ZUD6_9PSEU|nr:putative baseplate assembly protein [Kibdelosporangium philippinense]MCE7011212.1 putative baseplate assembly protein [Kibdelosporangium philippinense]